MRDSQTDTTSLTRLDSHATSPIVGCNCTIIHDTGRTASVWGFAKELKQLQGIRIVDALVAYDCPYTQQTVMLVIHNAYFVPSKLDNLIPPFLIREAGITVNDVPKIHCTNPTDAHHSIYFDEIKLRIPLQLRGIVSCFPSRKPEGEVEIEATSQVDLTPNREFWDPNDDTFQKQEESFIDHEGRCIDKGLTTRYIAATADGDEAHRTEDNMICSVNHFEENVIIGAQQAQQITKLADKLDGMWSQVPSIAAYEAYDPNIAFDECVDDELGELAEGLNNNLKLNKFKQAIGATDSSDPAVSPSRLAKVFKIDMETAKRTLKTTSQYIKRHDNSRTSRHYSTNDRAVRYKRIRDHFFMDTFFANKKIGISKRKNTCMQLFVTDKGYVFVVAMKSKGEVHKATKLFFKQVGIPNAIIADKSKEQTLGETKKICETYGVPIRELERNTPWANRAELYVGILKRAIRKDLKESNCPMVLWDYCAERRAKVNNMTARDLFQLQGQTPEFHVTGLEPDISNICRFEWYEWIYYKDEGPSFPESQWVLGRALGPTVNAGNAMSQWVMRVDGRVFPRRTVRSLSTEEIHSEVEQKKRETYDKAIKHLLGDSLEPTSDEMKEKLDETVFGPTYEPYEDEEEKPREIPDADEGEYDDLLCAELTLPHNDKMQRATVIRRAKNDRGEIKGRASRNPLMDSRTYEVMFEDGTVKEYSANLIAQEMYSQVDIAGHHQLLLDEIIGHRKTEEALTKDQMYIKGFKGKKHLRKTTKGWELQVLWKDGSTSWVKLKELKESNPYATAQYAKAQDIDREPAFIWWVKWTLRKGDGIVAAVNRRVQRATHKYGIKVPRTVDEALKLDKENKNDLWEKAIKKEMANVHAAFDILEDNENLPVGYSKATCHIIFDVKMDFTRKARYVKDGHKTPDPEGSTYAGVVSRESVRLLLTYAALNDLDVMAADIRNAYLQAPSSEKHYIICGAEFGMENKGKRAIIRRALYGGKVSGRDFRNSLRDCMKMLGFESCLADPDVWMRKAKKDNGVEVWEYVLLYVDDALSIGPNSEQVLRDIGKYFQLKEESVGPPDIYLGGRITGVTLEGNIKAWAFSSSKYVQTAVNNVVAHLAKQGNGKLPTKAKTPLSADYKPELDTTPELDPEDAAYFQSLIGILRWMVELGRVDICLEVSAMSSHLALPREGHLEQLYHIFAYLKMNHNSEMVFDPSDPDIDPELFKRQDWEATEFGELEEELPANCPEARGFGFIMTAYVDADHASDTITRRSRTGFIVYVQNSPIYWLSKKQNSIETSSFGSEFMAMKHCTEYVRGLRYKLRMLGIACELPTFIYGDNKSVLANVSVPDSVLKKKSNSIAYHFVREGSARDEWRIAYINTHENPADLLTKALPSGEKRTGFVKMILHHIFGGSKKVEA